MKKIETRKTEISVLNVLLCLLVIFIHVSSIPVTTLEKSSWQFAVVFFPWRLSGFVVPGFIFLSGLKLFLKTTEISYKRFYVSKIQKIIIPYIIWNIIYYGYFILRGYIEFSAQDFFKYVLNGNLVSPFYFVVVIVQFYALAPLWRKMVLKANPLLVLIISVLVTPLLGQYLPVIINRINPRWHFLYTDRTLTTYLFYWVAGCYSGVYFDRIKEMVKQYRFSITVIFLLAMIAEAVLSYITFTGLHAIKWLEYIHYLYCISTILFLFMAATVIYEHRTIKRKLFKDINAASYEIYLCHCLFIYLANSIMSYAGINGIATAYLIRIVIVYSSSIIFSIMLNRGKNVILSKFSSSYGGLKYAVD